MIDLRDIALQMEKVGTIRTYIIADIMETGAKSATAIANEPGIFWSIGTLAYHLRVLQARGYTRLYKKVPAGGSFERFYILTDLGKQTYEYFQGTEYDPVATMEEPTAA